jgi:multiple sugar transport system substrate-binding protein
MSAINTGTAPDMYEGTSSLAGTFASMDLLVQVDDLYDELEASGELDDWSMGALENFQYEGHWYAFPWSVVAHFTYYRTDMFEEYGVPIPENWTWEEFEEAAAALTQDLDGDGIMDTYGVVGEAGEHQSTEQHLFNWLCQGGGGFYDEDGNLNLTSPENIETVEWVAHIYRDYMPPDVAAWSANESWLAFQEGNVAMFLSGGWFGYGIQDLFGAENVRVTVLQGPARRCTRAEAQPILIFKTAKDIEAAKQFVRFMSQAENTLSVTAKDLSFIPIQLSAREDPELSKNQVFLDQMDFVLPNAHMMSYPSAFPVPQHGALESGLVYSKILGSVILEQQTAEEALAAAEAKAEELLEE